MEEFLNKRKSRLVAVSLLIILSVVVIFAGSRLYSQYREQVIRTEESQLLTMAGIVGNNINSYMEQQLEEIDLFIPGKNAGKCLGGVWRNQCEDSLLFKE